MKNDLRVSDGKYFRAFLLLFVIVYILFSAPSSYAAYSHSPRETGIEILDEVLMGTNRFVACVGSNGCTNKGSFKVDVKKREGISSKSPHYDLTIIRISPDECRAIMDDGVLILFDLEKDLGISGHFTYSILNPVFATSKSKPSENSLWSIFEKHFNFNVTSLKEIRPEPYEKFVMDHNYFTCLIPLNWELARDKEGDEKAGIFEIRLTKPDKEKHEDGVKSFIPDPLIYAGYYAKNNIQQKTYDDFMSEYEHLMKKNQGSGKSRYEKPIKIRLNGQAAVEYSYEVYKEVPRGPLFETKYWLKAKFVLLKAKEGVYVLAYKSPKETYDKHLPVFEEVVNSFSGKY